jgi:hypothetical protein
MNACLLKAAVLIPIALTAQDFKGPMTVELLGPLSTQINKKGDKITAQVKEPAAFAGAIVLGEVLEAKNARKLGGTSSINLAFRHMAHGDRRYDLSSEIVGFRNSKGVRGVDEEGRAIRHNPVKRNAILAGLAGAAIGYAAGGGSGAAVGAAAGVAAAIVMKIAAQAPAISFDTGSLIDLKVKAAPARN